MRFLLRFFASLNFRIVEADSPTRARLKLLYLVPVWAVTFVPCVLVSGWMSYGAPSVQMVWSVIRRGHC